MVRATPTVSATTDPPQTSQLTKTARTFRRAISEVPLGDQRRSPLRAANSKAYRRGFGVDI
jgi:hypothetical protein